MKITEIKGNSHVFTLKNGETLRIFARQTKTVPDNLVSDEVLRAEKMGLVRFTASPKEETQKTATEKKTGGAK